MNNPDPDKYTDRYQEQEVFKKYWITPIMLEKITSFSAFEHFINCYPDIWNEKVGGRNNKKFLEQAYINITPALLYFSNAPSAEKFKIYQWLIENKSFNIFAPIQVEQITESLEDVPVLEYMDDNVIQFLLMHGRKQQLSNHNFDFVKEILKNSEPKDFDKIKKTFATLKDRIIKYRYDYIDDLYTVKIKNAEAFIDSFWQNTLLKDKYQNKSKPLKMF